MDRNKIVVAQFYTSNVSYGQYAEAINKKYCDEKGYTYFCEKDNNKIMYCSSTCGEDSQIDRIWTHKGNTRPNKRNWRKFYGKED